MVHTLRKCCCKKINWMSILIEEKLSLDKSLKRKFHIKATTNKAYFRNMELLKSASTFSLHLAMKYKSLVFNFSKLLAGYRERRDTEIRRRSLCHLAVPRGISLKKLNLSTICAWKGFVSLVLLKPRRETASLSKD